MIPIHTILAYGEYLNSFVLNGVVINNTKLMPFSSEKVNSVRQNKWHSWRMAMNGRDKKLSLFIGMNSSIILSEGVIDKLICSASDYDCITYATDDGLKSHGLWMVKTEVIENVIFEFAGSDRCPLCVWFSKIEEQGFKVKRISSIGIKQWQQQ